MKITINIFYIYNININEIDNLTFKKIIKRKIKFQI
jgi:hypothetical protein